MEGSRSRSNKDWKSDGNGINVAVDDAVIASRDHGLVVEILHEYNVSGEKPLSQFAEVINSILQQKRSFHVLVANDKTMMIVVDDNGTLIFIDSHMHGHSGALVARSDPYQGQQAQSFSTWVYAEQKPWCGSVYLHSDHSYF